MCHFVDFERLGVYYAGHLAADESSQVLLRFSEVTDFLSFLEAKIGFGQAILLAYASSSPNLCLSEKRGLWALGCVRSTRSCLGRMMGLLHCRSLDQGLVSGTLYGRL